MGNRILAGRYELIDMIGNGGMAVVYKAKDRLLNRFVAIKILKPSYSKDAKFIENFRRESRAAASLSHPNIVGIFDVGWEGNINFIVMELVEGRTLADIIAEKGALNPRDAVTYAKQIASALSHAHEHQIIHRDVKPHNVLITQENTAKLTDFGIAKAADMGTMVGNTGTVLGSVHYLSPEQARGGYVDEKTDIYSLGIVMYEMLTGRVPYDADNPVAVALMHVNNEIIPPRELRPDIPAEVEAVVLKATQKYPVNRYKTADEMLDALQNASLAAIGIIHTADGYEKAEQPREMQEPEKVRTIAKTAPVRIREVLAKRIELPGLGSADQEKVKKPILPERAADGKDTMKKTKKKERKQRDWALVCVRTAAILLGILIAFPLSKGIHARIEAANAPVEVVVPPLAGYTVEQAEAALEKMGLTVTVGTEVASYEYKAGQIVSQTPKADNVVKVGNTVTVNVSKGMSTGIVPNVVGQSEDGAKYLIEQNEYAVGSVTREYSDTVPVGKVISQSPVADAAAAAGQKISFTVSLGKEDNTVAVPNLQMMEKKTAFDTLDGRGLVLGQVEYKPSNTISEGQIISQSVEADERVERGTQINVVISSGPDTLGGGRDVKLVIDLSKAEKASFELAVKLIGSDGMSQNIPPVSVKRSDKSYTLTLSDTGKASAVIFFDQTKAGEAAIDFDAGTVTWN